MTKKFWNSLVSPVMAALFLSLTTTALQAAVLYSQPGGGNGGLTSGTNGGSRAVFDDFTLSTDAQLTRVEWIGLVSGSSPSNVAAAPDVRFTLSLRGNDDVAGGPTQSPVVFLPQDVVVPRVALGSFGNSAGFRYELDLPTAVNLAAGTRYWLQITAGFVSQSDDLTLRWDWTNGDGPNLVSYANVGGGGNGNSNGYASFATDLTFSLFGTPAGNTVPEPTGGLLLAAAGVAVVVANKRRR